MLKSLEEEIARWDKPAKLWLRDDDAIAPATALDRLGEFADRFQIPTVIAVIPQLAEKQLARWVEDNRQMKVAMHGISHINHAGVNEKKCELGLHRGRQIIIDELSEHCKRSKDMFGEHFTGMLVPPWNRIDKSLIPELEAIGFSSLSTYGWACSNDILQINTHVDIIDWKASRSGWPLDKIIDDLCSALQHARENNVGPVGILTHHLVHDEKNWQMLSELLEILAAQEKIEWI